MSVWAGRAQRAVAFAVGLANRNIAGETEAEAFADEGSEGEVIKAWVARGFGREDARGGAVYVGCHGLMKSVASRFSRDCKWQKRRGPAYVGESRGKIRE